VGWVDRHSRFEAPHVNERIGDEITLDEVERFTI
jgi:hypothetical protein